MTSSGADQQCLELKAPQLEYERGNYYSRHSNAEWRRVNVQWMLGVQQAGSVRFWVTVEAVP